jgi:hypothetical protein
MRLLIDQNVPQPVADLFASRGHEVLYSRDVLQQNSPDQLIAITAALEGLIVVTLDADFKRYRDLFPQGFRARARQLTGRVVIGVKEPQAAARVNQVIDLIEFHYGRAAGAGLRLMVTITATGFNVTDNARLP